LVCSSLSDISIPDSVTSIGNYAFSGCSHLARVFIPASVETIGESAFFYCSSLSTVFYQGSYDLSASKVFEGCNDLKTMCVSPTFGSTSFCGVDVTSDNETCQTFRSSFNNCFEVTDLDGTIMKRKNATEWEQQTNNCMENFCDNSSGRMSRSKCFSSGDTIRMCVNDECVENTRTLNEKPSVKIDIEDGVNIGEINTTEIREVFRVELGIELESVLVIGWESDDFGNVISVIIYVDDEDTAIAVLNVIEKIDKKSEEQCREAIVFCKRKSAYVKLPDFVLSSSFACILDTLILAVISMIWMVSTYHW